MTKLRLFLPILVALSLIGVPAQGAEAMNVEQPAAPQGMVAKSKQAVSNAKKRAQAQFKESVDRFNRCIRGKCTKTEALKAARDLTIAAGAAIAAMYVTGALVQYNLAMKKKLGLNVDDWVTVSYFFENSASSDQKVEQVYGTLEINPINRVVGFSATGLPIVKDESGKEYTINYGSMRKVPYAIDQTLWVSRGKLLNVTEKDKPLGDVYGAEWAHKDDRLSGRVVGYRGNSVYLSAWVYMADSKNSGSPRVFKIPMDMGILSTKK